MKEKKLKEIFKKLLGSGCQKPWIWIQNRISIEKKCRILIRIETYADPKHCFVLLYVRAVKTSLNSYCY